jgi:hypothetical protein
VPLVGRSGTGFGVIFEKSPEWVIIRKDGVLLSDWDADKRGGRRCDIMR